ncbi:MAG: hypothetical protein EXR62_02205 [Chloroflexi bacterium]|nr:hypothetical protein [Chloroflexota bacterium]
MPKELDALLDECLYQLKKGARVEELLVRYPEAADELRPLLLTMTRVYGVAPLVPDQAVRLAGRERLLQAVAAKQAAAVQQTAVVKLQLSQKPQRQLSWDQQFVVWLSAMFQATGPVRRMAMIVAAFVVITGVSGYSVSQAAANSLPTSPLYPVKLAQEQLEMSLLTSPEDRARLHLVLANRRLEEFNQLVEQGGQVNSQVLEGMQAHTDLAAQEIKSLDKNAYLSELVDLTKKQEVSLVAAKDRLDSHSQEALDTALESVRKDKNGALNRIQQSVVTATPEVPTVTVVPPSPTISVTSTDTLAPPTATLAPPPATPLPPTATLAPPPATPVPPTATLAPPPATPLPPTATPAPPTATPQVQGAGGSQNTPITAPPPGNTPLPTATVPVVQTPSPPSQIATPTPQLGGPKLPTPEPTATNLLNGGNGPALLPTVPPPPPPSH